MAAGTRECERLPRDLRCAERAGAEPREQCSRDEKQAQQRREKARRFPPPSRVLRVSKFDSNRPSFDRAKKILTGRNVLLRRSIGIAPRFERARVPNSKILESFALVAPSGSRLLGLSGPRDRATRIQSRGFGWGSRGQQALGEVARADWVIRAQEFSFFFRTRREGSRIPRATPRDAPRARHVARESPHCARARSCSGTRDRFGASGSPSVGARSVATAGHADRRFGAGRDPTTRFLATDAWRARSRARITDARGGARYPRSRLARRPVANAPLDRRDGVRFRRRRDRGRARRGPRRPEARRAGSLESTPRRAFAVPRGVDATPSRRRLVRAPRARSRRIAPRARRAPRGRRLLRRADGGDALGRRARQGGARAREAPRE